MDDGSVNGRDDGASVWGTIFTGRHGGERTASRSANIYYILGGGGDNGRNTGGAYLCAFSCVCARAHGVSPASVSASAESVAPRAGSGIHSAYMCGGGHTWKARAREVKVSCGDMVA